MELWQLLAGSLVAVIGLAGTVVTVIAKRKTDSAATSVSEFDILTQRMNEYTDRITARMDQYQLELDACRKDCADCHNEHAQTQRELESVRQEAEKTSARLRALEAEMYDQT